MKLRIVPLAVIVLAAFAFGIAGAAALGYWVTESSKTPARLAAGEFAGQADPADIRGSYSFGDIEEAFGVPAVVLAEAFGFREGVPSEIKAKDLEEFYAGKTGDMEVGTDAVRFFVAAWKGIPYEPEETTGLTAEAAAMLLERDLHPATASLVRLRIVGGDAPAEAPPADRAAPVEAAVPAAEPEVPAPAGTGTGSGSGAGAGAGAEDDSGVFEVKGRTTFGELYAQGLTAAQIQEALGGRDPGPAAQSVRDYCSAAGVEYSDVRVRLQAMLEKN